MQEEPDKTPRRRKVMTRSTFEEVCRMIDDGCPNSLDLDEYEIIEDAPESSTANA
jgi:hypothetical protein